MRALRIRLLALEARTAHQNIAPQVYPSIEAARAAGARGAVLIVADDAVRAALVLGRWQPEEKPHATN